MLTSTTAGRRLWFLAFATCTAILFFFTLHTRPRIPTDILGEPTVDSEVEAEPPRRVPFPKKIWQSWKDDSQNPTDRTVGFPHQWRAQNVGYRYERITDKNMETYIRDRAPNDIADAFLALEDPILRADLLRYIIMLLEGGVWSDIDVLPHRPIDEWIPQEYKHENISVVIGIENDHKGKPIWRNSPFSVQLCQYTMLAKPGHPAFAELVRRVVANIDKLGASRSPLGHITFEEVMSTTGPFAFTEVMMEYFNNVTSTVHTGKEMTAMEQPRLIGDVLVMPKDGFGWLPHENTHPKGDPVILVEHLFIGSWRGSHPGQ